MELTKAQKDILIAEALGDIGKLHDRVGELFDKLGQLGDEFTSARAGMLATIEDAVNAVQPHAVKVFKLEAETAADQHKAVLRRLIEDAVAAPIREATHNFKLQADLAKQTSDQLRKQLADTLWRFWMPVGGLAATFVLVLGLGAVTFGYWLDPQSFLSKAQREDLATGAQLHQAWSHMDEATQRKVMAAMSATQTK